MQNSGFFNSVNGDRKYKAEFFAEYFASFIGNGVFPNPSTGLQVMGENNDMTVTVKAGNGWINGYYYINNDDLILNIDVAGGVLNRIDRIVLQYNTADRTIIAKVKKGAFASSPVAPILQRDADAYELGIADIYIAAGATQITQANITDLRLNTSLCGIVHGTVQQVDTTTLFNQYLSWYNNITSTSQQDIDDMEAQFQQDWNDWFATVQNALGSDVAGNLLNMINNLSGEGRTTETVKGNAVAIANLTEEVAELAARPQKDVDNGRYQSDFGLEDAVLSGCVLNNNIASLDITGYIDYTFASSSDYTTSTTNAVGIVITPKFIITKIKLTALEASMTKWYIYKQSDNSLIASGSYVANGELTGFTLSVGVSYRIVVDNNGNTFTRGNKSIALPIDTSLFTVNSGYYELATIATAVFLASFSAYGTVKNLSGTATKTVTPSDLKKWGNVKVTAANLGANNSATVTVKSSSGALTFKAPVTLANGDNYIDISDINSISYPSLKVVITLNRNSTGDASPTISDVSVTWEGNLVLPTIPTIPKVVNGTYTGDGVSNRTISVGFTPKLVFITSLGEGISGTSSETLVYGGTGSSALKESNSGIAAQLVSQQNYNSSYNNGQIVSNGFLIKTGAGGARGMNYSNILYGYTAIG